MSTYRFQPPTARPASGTLPEGDYNYTVSEIVGEPRVKLDTGNMVLKVKVSIQPEGTSVFADLWARTEKSLIQDGRDGIAEFLISCNRAPKAGEEPDWDEVVGARGRCHLKVEVAQKGNMAGKKVNKVAWFIAPKQVGPSANKQSASKGEFEKARKTQEIASGGATPEEDDQIPY